MEIKYLLIKLFVYLFKFSLAAIGNITLSGLKQKSLLSYSLEQKSTKIGRTTSFS